MDPTVYAFTPSELESLIVSRAAVRAGFYTDAHCDSTTEIGVVENGMAGLVSGDWNRSTASGPQRRQPDAWTAPDVSATAPAADSTPFGLYPF